MSEFGCYGCGWGDGFGHVFGRGVADGLRLSGSGNGYVFNWGDGRGCETGGGNKDFTGEG